MCGIVGYTGWRKAQDILINNLSKLEYRGYDSCGLALRGSKLKIFKDEGRVGQLAQKLGESVSTTGIGHTRWATHGPPNQINAHPHVDCYGKIAVVHNGVITNYQKLKTRLISSGHRFVSETDTEVISHLIEENYQGDLPRAVYQALESIEGSYAIIAVCEDYHGLVFARKDSPMIIGIGDKEYFLASDVPAILEYTDRVIYLEDGDCGSLSPDELVILNGGKPVARAEQKIQWTSDQAQKGGYEHFMIKEIHEQPKVIRETVSEYLSGQELIIDKRKLEGTVKNIIMLACGSSYHAALVGKYVIEQLLDVPIRVEMASEFNYLQKIPQADLAIGVTQSGETADTLKAMRRLKAGQSTVLSITNVVGSTASKLADTTIYTRAGPEISVAATKSFTAQLTALYLLALSQSNGGNRYPDLIIDFRQLPSKVQETLALEKVISRSARQLANYDNVFFVGRGINYPIALEGALKLKEISYIHAEAYAGGEIKHGPFALLSKQTPVVAIISRDSSHDAMLTTVKEIRARGSPIYAIVEDSDDSIIDMADYLIPVPSTRDIFMPFINTVAVQLLAYFAAKERSCAIDFPRNLAKSVTVE
jgi:glucosamine--fructose-6-phosphate aminotransferase (isomerizing)